MPPKLHLRECLRKRLLSGDNRSWLRADRDFRSSLAAYLVDSGPSGGSMRYMPKMPRTDQEGRAVSAIWLILKDGRHVAETVAKHGAKEPAQRNAALELGYRSEGGDLSVLVRAGEIIVGTVVAAARNLRALATRVRRLSEAPIEGLGGLKPLNQTGNTDEVDHAFDVVGKHLKAHLGAYIR